MTNLIDNLKKNSEEETALIQRYNISKDNLKPLIWILRLNWNYYMMGIAQQVSSRSSCLSRQNGAVIIRDKKIISTGYSGAAPGIKECSTLGFCLRRRLRNNNEDKVIMKYTNEKIQKITSKEDSIKLIKEIMRDTKNDLSQSQCLAYHAEHNAILQAAKLGITLEGSELYMTLFPCDKCAKDIITAGIKRVYYWNKIDDSQKHGAECMRTVEKMFDEKGIIYKQIIPSSEYLTALRIYNHLLPGEKRLQNSFSKTTTDKA